jgi:uncharacterized membrane-anchored protein
MDKLLGYLLLVSSIFMITCTIIMYFTKNKSTGILGLLSLILVIVLIVVYDFIKRRKK